MRSTGTFVQAVMKSILILTLIVSPVLQGQDTGSPGSVAESRELRQQAMELEQTILIASEQEREMVAGLADQLLANFDRRIEALAEDLERRRTEMSAAERRYSSELMQALANQRQDVSQRLGELRANEAETWDHLVYNFTSAYESFYEMWEDVESNFGLPE